MEIKQAIEAIGVAVKMTPLEMIAEWRKGCTCADSEHPEQCPECTRELINAMEKVLPFYQAAPDMAAWIKKALPWLKISLGRMKFVDYDDSENRAYCDRDIAALEALIAEAVDNKS